MFRSTKRWSNRGDTIVEVLISIAVVSSVLAGAFTVTQKSTLAVRSSQEHGEMLQLLQGQVELVRSIALSNSVESKSLYDASPDFFCINPDNKEKEEFPSDVNDIETLESNPAKYHASCRNLGDANVYNIAVTYNPTNEVFTFYGRWDKAGGGMNALQLSYRLAAQPLAVNSGTSPAALSHAPLNTREAGFVNTRTI